MKLGYSVLQQYRCKLTMQFLRQIGKYFACALLFIHSIMQMDSHSSYTTPLGGLDILTGHVNSLGTRLADSFCSTSEWRSKLLLLLSFLKCMNPRSCTELHVSYLPCLVVNVVAIARLKCTSCCRRVVKAMVEVSQRQRHLCLKCVFWN